MRPRRPLAALLLACSVLASGCGGTDSDVKNAYVTDVQTAQKLYATRFEQVRERLTATSTLSEDRATLADFASTTQTFVGALERIDPPEEVREEHARLTATAAGYARQVTEARAALARGTTADRAKVRTRLSSSVESTQARFVEAIAGINAGLQG